MGGLDDWKWKLTEAVERLRTRYEHIGRKTGAPFLAIVYPPEAERSVLKEWRTLATTLDQEFSIQHVDVLEVTTEVVRRIGSDALVDSMNHPMPGSDPTTELGTMWTMEVAARVREASKRPGPLRPVVVLERLAALYPASGPHALMQALWDDEQVPDCPVMLLIPGVIVEARVYRFVGQVEEFMYRGDIL